MRVNIKDNVEKDSTLLLFFHSKSPGGPEISRQKHLPLPVVSYLLIELFYIGMPVVPTTVWLSGVRSRITKISRMNGLPNLLRYGALL